MTEVFDPRNQSPWQFLDYSAPLGFSKEASRRLLGAVIGKGDYSPTSWKSLGLLPRSAHVELADLPKLSFESVSISQVDGFRKLLFRLNDGLAIESVLIPLHRPGYATVCLSSQVGCVMGCVFCATARMEKRRNLKTWEIVDQFIQTREYARSVGLRVSGAVFMGMGEPFLNYDRVISAAEILCFPVTNAIRSKAITISTVGLIPEIRRFTSENRPFRLSISLGAATDEKRAKLVPVASRFKIKDLMLAAKEYAESRNDRVNLSYVCIAGENVSVDDARELANIIGDTKVRLDLIDVNDNTGRFTPPTSEELKIFRDALSKYLCQPVVRRYSGGKDIDAACGTLAAKAPKAALTATLGELA